MILATNNKGKLREVREILNDYEILSLKDAKIDIEVEEDQNTFYGNALKKAQEIYMITGMPVIADDSGLIIDALENWPGVLTHRFLGDKANDDDRNRALIARADSLDNRQATVVCVLVYYDGENTLVGEGKIHGQISKNIRGENGFGFDAIFELSDGRTLAELTPKEKNTKSARYLASVDLRDKLNTLRENSKIIKLK